MFFERYNKKIIEEFAVRTIAHSYDSSYGLYILPENSDNFDGIAPDNGRALEITLVVPENSMEAYTYEKLFAQGKRNLCTKRIKNAKTKPSGELRLWEGGTAKEIVEKIQEAVNKKEEKAKNRLQTQAFDSVDLCICIDDGGWFDENDFPLIDIDLAGTLFENIFFITCRLFFRYTKESGFERYPRIIQ